MGHLGGSAVLGQSLLTSHAGFLCGQLVCQQWGAVTGGPGWPHSCLATGQGDGGERTT